MCHHFKVRYPHVPSSILTTASHLQVACNGDCVGASGSLASSGMPVFRSAGLCQVHDSVFSQAHTLPYDLEWVIPMSQAGAWLLPIISGCFQQLLAPHQGVLLPVKGSCSPSRGAVSGAQSTITCPGAMPALH